MFLSCCKCGPCRPKWMKMVDNLYSGSPQDTNNHNKLIHYCLHQPDKLDRIAKYLHLRLSQDLNRRYDQNISISVKAIDKLIQVCHGHRLVLAISFLKMIQLLLETNRTDLQIMASKSFVEFSKIDDDSPNYHKECNEILDHFAAMAHASFPNPQELSIDFLKLAGIQGIQGVVRKMVSDQLILEVHESNMDKIVLPLLFNMYTNTIRCRLSGLRAKHPRAGSKVLGSGPVCGIGNAHYRGVPYWDETAVQCFQVFQNGLTQVSSWIQLLSYILVVNDPFLRLSIDVVITHSVIL
ncbi:unnamed protein product [Schistosoma margrebowiei]|uniref:Uncharacterized protein n=1 Tax=Schistosoma margrebowiei TaxID=48269 RepID=A0A3P8C9D8_9TREM|nr:unnamed protein product [Schistosoma margrebowiei]